MRNENQSDNALLSARLMVGRKQYEAARTILEELIERRPECAEAKELLLIVEKELVSKARRESEVDEGINVFFVQGVFAQLGVAVAGAVAVTFSIVVASPMLAQLAREGLASKSAYRPRYSLEPVNLPTYTVLLIPLVLMLLGAALVFVAYRSWRER